MRGLPFPQDAAFHREESHEYGPSPGATPTPGIGDMHIDPMLAMPAINPIYAPNGIEGLIIPQDAVHHPHDAFSPLHAYQRYPQGPQGDPFAPQPPPHFYPTLSPTLKGEPASLKPMKRKRKPRREEDCGFCGGNNSKNKDKEPERMVACDECGRSGHPSCMELGDIGEILRSYPWKCIECKICEICQEKGDDERILFCDNCDRGWHMDCLSPPVKDTPEGSWFCPMCAEFVLPSQDGQLSEPQSAIEPEAEPPIDPALQMDIDPALREFSVASSSQHPDRPRKSKSKSKSRSQRDRRGKERATMGTDESEDVDVELGAEEDGVIGESEMNETATIASRSRAFANSKKKSKSRARRRSESVPDDIASPPPPPRPQKRMRLIVRSPSPAAPPLPPTRQKTNTYIRPKIRLRLPPNSKGKEKVREDDEEDETKRGLFDDVLGVEERDTTKTSVSNHDKVRFEKSRITAESKLVPPLPSDLSDLATPGPSTLSGRFPLRSAIHQLQQLQTQSLVSSPLPTSPSPSTPGPSIPKFDPTVLRIRSIRFGPFDIKTWYDAPFPEEFSNIPDGRLWICEFCLKYMKSKFGAQRHRLKCKCRHPPGDEIYRDGTISVFEVDGRKNKIYCQHLCLLSKMFLDHKSLFYDVEPFLFYVMTEVDDIGARFVGYFSKEKRSPKDLNLSCIMTLPVRQRQGWGNLLIDFSYLLSKKEQRSGTPEKPLSALGAISYKKYWTLALMRYLHNAPNDPRLEDISAATSMTIEDIYNTLQQQHMITVEQMQSPPVRPSPGRSIRINRSRKIGFARKNLQKGQPKDDEKNSKAPFTPPSEYEIHWDRDKVNQFLSEWESKGYLTLKPDRLKWTPFLLTRADKMDRPTPMLDDASAAAAIEASLFSAAASSSASATASVANVDVAVDAPPQATPDAEPETAVDEVDSTDRPSAMKGDVVKEDVVEDDVSMKEEPTKEILSEAKRSTADPEESQASSAPSPSPCPSPVPSPPVSTGNLRASGLEALAAVAAVASKANPVRKNSAPNGGSSPLQKNKLAGVKPAPDYLHPVPFSASHQHNNPSVPVMTAISPPASIVNSSPTSSLSRLGPKRHVNGHTSSEEVLHSLTPAPAQSPVEVPRLSERADSPVSSTADVVDQDAELAAKLAAEEVTRRRSLRPKSLSQSATPTLNTQDLRSKDSSRKRKKAASPVREPSPSPLTPITPDRPITRRQAQAQALESARSNRLTRSQSTKLAGSVNGNGNGNGDVQTTPGLRTSSRLNGINNSKKASSPSISMKSSRGRTSPQDDDEGDAENHMLDGRRTRSSKTSVINPRTGHSNEVNAGLNGIATADTNGDNDADANVDADADAEGESDVDAEGEPDIPSEEEAMDGHVNGIMDKSNDSVLSTNGDAGVSMKEPPHTPTAPRSLPHDLTGTLANGVVQPSGKAALDPEEDADIDAEGEDDIDAEGEPDDEDAEGELDPDLY